MNYPHSTEFEKAESESLQTIFNQQRAAFNVLPYPDLDSRRSQLFNLKKQIILV